MVKQRQAPLVLVDRYWQSESGTGGAARRCAELGFRPFGALATTRVESKNLDGAPVMLCFFGKRGIKLRLDSLIQHKLYEIQFTKLQKQHR